MAQSCGTLTGCQFIESRENSHPSLSIVDERCAWQLTVSAAMNEAIVANIGQSPCALTCWLSDMIMRLCDAKVSKLTAIRQDLHLLFRFCQSASERS